MTRATLCLGLMLTIPAALGAGELTVTSDRDNTLYEDQAGGLSNGAGQHFFAGLTAEGQIRRGLVHFDLTAVPPGSTVESVEMTATMSMTIAGPVPVALHALTSDWGEGASDALGNEGGGAPAEADDATWLHTFFDTDFWSNAGGDFAAAPSATITVDQVGSYSWGSTAEMVADVQAWVDDPAQNFGWLVLGDESQPGKGNQTAKRFDTREIGTEGALGPQLVVQFTPPVPVELLTVGIDED